MTESWLDHLTASPPQVAADPGGRVLVVSAHPDDEVLAVGAWLSSQRERDITFVTATDGEASHPGSPTVSPEELRDRRPAELLDALRALGFVAPRVHRLMLPDSELALERDELVRRLRPYVAAAALVLAPYRRDGHSDHDVVGSVAAELCSADTVLWELPIWTWAWTTPGSEPWASSTLRALTEEPGDRRCKRRALGEFTTQVRPLSVDPADRAVVGDALLAHALRAPEVVLT